MHIKVFLGGALQNPFKQGVFRNSSIGSMFRAFVLGG
jgi:hypothetical protein